MDFHHLVLCQAGIQVGDVIVEFDGKKVTTYKSFLTELYSKEPGDKVELVINRNGQERKVSVVTFLPSNSTITSPTWIPA